MAMDWNLFWPGATTVLTFGLLIATGVYAYLTYRLVKASEAQQWEIARPRLVVAIRTNQGGQFILLHLENVGLTSAEDLKLSLDRPVHQQFGSNDNIADVPILSEGVPALPPGTRVRIGLGAAHAYLNQEADRDLHPLSFSVEATYRSGSREVQESFVLDVRRQLDHTSVDVDYLEEFGRTFPAKFSKEIQGLARALKGNP